MKIFYKYPTRNRPAWFKKTLQTYYDMKTIDIPCQFLVTLDEDDVSMNNKDMIEYLNQMEGLKYHFGKHSNKIEAINAGVDLVSDWDIVVLVSDDMIPIIEGFDKIIVEVMKIYFPDTDGALHFNDGLFGKDKTITLSILGRALYEQLGYLYHPDYKSFYCDNEFTDVVYQMGKVVYLPQVIIKHAWSGGPHSADELYKRNSRMGAPDETTYKRRKAAGFPK
jgi:hypothetical protein